MTETNDEAHALREAAEAADQFISRLQELIGEHLSKGDGLDEKEAFYQVVEALETSHEITTLRLALGQDPSRFGDRTPLASASNTG